LGHDVFYWVLVLIFLPVVPIIIVNLILYKKTGSVRDTQYIIIANIGNLVIAVNTIVILIIHVIHENFVPFPVHLIPLTLLILIILGVTTRIMKTGLRHQTDIRLLSKEIRKGNLNVRIDNPTFLQDSMFGPYSILINDLLETISTLAQEKKQFIKTLSHEVRTPLSIIDLSTNNLGSYWEKMSKDEWNNLIETITVNTKNITNLIENLQTFLSIEDYLERELVTYSPSRIILEVIEKLKPKYYRKRIEIIQEIDSNIQLLGDKRQIRIILSSILDNAIKYSEDDSVIKFDFFHQYSGKYNPDNKDGELFQFRDQGQGIRPNDIQHVFDPFFRTNDATTISGAGLGLFIAKKIVNNHDGEIYVESKYGSGSVFSVFMPRQIDTN